MLEATLVDENLPFILFCPCSVYIYATLGGLTLSEVMVLSCLYVNNINLHGLCGHETFEQPTLYFEVV